MLTATSIPPGALAIVKNAAAIKPGEQVAVIVDRKSVEIGRHFADAASFLGAHVGIVEIPLAAGHGVEPPAECARATAHADVILSSTTFSISHSQMRVNLCKRGARFLSLADYDDDMLYSGGAFADFKASAPITRRIAELFGTAKTVHVTTPAGTEITLSAEGRSGNAAPAYCPNPGDFGSPPDIESNFAPVEHKTEGRIVVDGSVPFPGLGLIRDPICIKVTNGLATDIFGGKQADVLRGVWDSYGNPAVRVVAELGLGLNPLARLCGRMLEDEGAFGTVHFGFGANTTLGGQNVAPVHIDLICRKATVSIDGQAVLRSCALT